MPLTVPGNEIAKIGAISIYEEGLKYSLLITFRAVSAVLLIFPMIGTTRFDLTIKALGKLKIPCKLIQILMFTYRYIFVFMDEIKKTFSAAKIRGFKKGINMQSLKIISNILGMLFIYSIESTQDIYKAMISRGYYGYFNTLDEFKLSKKDFITAFLIVVVAIIIGFAGWNL